MRRRTRALIPPGLGHMIGHKSRDRLGHLEEHTGLSLIENMITERINENERWSLEEMIKI